MNCLFCECNTDNTKSVEHIVPESLCNGDHVLPLGFICDKCNNYFAIKVEKPFLSNTEIIKHKFHFGILNKKERPTIVDGSIDGVFPARIVGRKEAESTTIVQVDEKTADYILEAAELSLYVPIPTSNIFIPDDKTTSRFIAKVAIESLAERLGNTESIINNEGYSKIRKHARYGVPNYWPCKIRRLHSFDQKITIDEHNTGFLMYASDFLIIPSNIEEGLVEGEIYFVMVLWGIEIAINMGGPSIDGYNKWLKEHNDISPLKYEY